MASRLPELFTPRSVRLRHTNPFPTSCSPQAWHRPRRSSLRIMLDGADDSFGGGGSDSRGIEDVFSGGALGDRRFTCGSTRFRPFAKCSRVAAALAMIGLAISAARCGANAVNCLRTRIRNCPWSRHAEARQRRRVATPIAIVAIANIGKSFAASPMAMIGRGAPECCSAASDPALVAPRGARAMDPCC